MLIVNGNASDYLEFTMIKMIIKMNDDRLRQQNEYTPDKVYSTLDRIFEQKGMERIETNKGVEYRGHDKPTDFGHFGQIMIGLKKQSWFMDNASTWLFCNNDDVDDPSDFSEEDLLAHYKRKFAPNGR